MPAPKKEKKDEGEVNLSQNLEQLARIAAWFEEQDEIDIEEGLKKVKEASGLIKESRGRLQDIENEFQEIKKTIEDELEEQE